jgi:hypothetical protein
MRFASCPPAVFDAVCAPAVKFRRLRLDLRKAHRSRDLANEVVVIEIKPRLPRDFFLDGKRSRSHRRSASTAVR